jgi:hypothetical protein
MYSSDSVASLVGSNADRPCPVQVSHVLPDTAQVEVAAGSK